MESTSSYSKTAGTRVYRAILLRSLTVSLVVGSLIIVFNHGDSIRQNMFEMSWLVNYLIPFSVSTFVGWQASRGNDPLMRGLSSELEEARKELHVAQEDLRVRQNEITIFKTSQSERDLIAKALQQFLEIARRRQQDKQFYDTVSSLICRTMQAGQAALILCLNVAPI